MENQNVFLVNYKTTYVYLGQRILPIGDSKVSNCKNAYILIWINVLPAQHGIQNLACNQIHHQSSYMINSTAFSTLIASNFPNRAKVATAQKENLVSISPKNRANQSIMCYQRLLIILYKVN